MRSDDTPRVDREWVNILNTYGLKYTLCANVPYYNVLETQRLMLEVEKMGHEICDHTPYHTTFFSDVPDKYTQYFTSFIGNGIIRTQKDHRNGVSVTRFTYETVVNESYLEHRIGNALSYQTKLGESCVYGDFSSTPVEPLLVYIDNNIGEKIGWRLVYEKDTNKIILSNNDGTAPIFSANENINMYAVTADVFNFSITENATYCLLLSGQCWFDYCGLSKPLTWNQPGGAMPFVDRDNLIKALERLGMRGAETDQTLVEGFKATYNYSTPYLHTCHNWDGGYLSFDACDGSENWLNEVKALISDYIAKRNIRTMATHFNYSNFPGNTSEEKKQNWIKWFDKLFKWISDSEIDMLTLDERNMALYTYGSERKVNVFPELWYDRADRVKPDGFTIKNNLVTWTNKGLPKSKNKALEIEGDGIFFEVSDLGALEKGRNKLTFFVKGDYKTQVKVKTRKGLSIPQYNPLPYLDTEDIFVIKKLGWNKCEVILDIPLDMNYINISLEVLNNPSTCSISDIQLKGK